MVLLNETYFTWNLGRLWKLKKVLTENNYKGDLGKEVLEKIVHDGMQMKSKFGRQTYMSLKDYLGNIQDFLIQSNALQNAPLAMAIFSFK